MSYEVRVGAGPGVENWEANEARSRNKERDQAASSSACLPRSTVLPGKTEHMHNLERVYTSPSALSSPTLSGRTNSGFSLENDDLVRQSYAER
jgi:hypothetical protein